jgi:prophage maintenance system killer protein
MENKIEIYQLDNKNTEIKVQFDEDTVWLTQKNMAELFQTTPQNITLHLKNIFKESELDEDTTCKDFLQVQIEGKRKIKRKQKFYNLDAIISVGYRIKSQVATKFRQWATQRLKDYLVQGYTINEKRLEQKQQQVEYLKTGIRIISQAIEKASDDKNKEVFQIFSKGLELLDDYDHEELDKLGKTTQETIYPEYNDYMTLIQNMYSEFKSDIFAKPKDDSFKSSINQIKQGFDNKDLYPTIEEKAANLLYFITKNHSFVDGNKRIAAACFLYFLDMNKALIIEDEKQIIDNNTLAALTLFIASSKTEEAEIVKRLVISILNRNK